MDTHNTLLAIQILSGNVEAITVRFRQNDEWASAPYPYKAKKDEYWPGQIVLVPVARHQKIAVARVEEVGVAPDYEAEYPLRWVIAAIEDPFAKLSDLEKEDNAAIRKLQESQAYENAKRHLAHLGVDPQQFMLSDKKEEE